MRVTEIWVTWSGSSPLARGLPPGLGGAADDARIIPARAGFTVLRYNNITGDEDHPRSRGVYPGVHVEGLPPRGSSPLARGLPLQAGTQGV